MKIIALALMLIPTIAVADMEIVVQVPGVRSAAWVKLYQFDELDKHLDSKAAEKKELVKLIEDATEEAKRSDHALDKLTEVLDVSKYLSSTKFYMRGANDIASERTTDSGIFSIKVPAGDYALYAEGNDTEWLVKVPSSGIVDLTEANTVHTKEKVSILFNLNRPSETSAALGEYRLENLKRDFEGKRKLAEAKAKAEKHQQNLVSYQYDPKLAQHHAVELLPAIGEAGTPENKEFVERAARYRQEKPDFFNEPDWPVRLAEEIKSSPAKENPPK